MPTKTPTKTPDHFPDDPGPWKVLTREYLAKKLWYTVRVDRVELPNGTDAWGASSSTTGR